MMKQQFYCLTVLALIAFNACKKTDTTTPVNTNIVGTWKLDKVTPSKLTGVYANLNNQSFDAVSYFGFSSVYVLNTDNSFTDKETDNGVTTDYSGTFSLSGTTLTLKYKDNSVETFSYDEANKKMTFNDTGTTLTFTNPNTKKEEDIVCDAIYTYLKQ